MAYTENVPQGTQTVSQTQPIINANFQYLKPAINQEHNFDATDPAKTYHKKASMPNMATPGALPTGTHGMYYVTGAQAHFFDSGLNDWLLSTWKGVATGTFTAGGAYSTIVTLSADVSGIVILYSIATPATCMGSFVTDGANCYAFAIQSIVNSSNPLSSGSPTSVVELKNSTLGSFNLQGKKGSSAYDGVTFNYIVFYRPR